MRKGNLFLLLLAIAMGGVAAYLAQEWIAAHAVPAPKSGTVVVAAVPLTFGTALTNENLTEISWASGKVPEGAYATRDELLKDGRRVVLAPLQRNELVLKTKITGPGQRASLSALLAGFPFMARHWSRAVALGRELSPFHESSRAPPSILPAWFRID